MQTINITKKEVETLPYSQNGQIRYKDSKLMGFGIRVSKSTKSYFVEKKIHSRTVRVTIGKHGQLTSEQARKIATQLLAQMTAGLNPLDEKKAKKAKAITLAEAFQDFKKVRKNLKPKTLYDYEKTLNRAFPDWLKKPITAITKDMVSKRHFLLGSKSGKGYANLAMRVLRSILNFAKNQYEDSKGNSLIIENPVSRISQTRAWYPEKRRKRIIKPYELANWFNSVNQLKNEVLKDYLIFVLFTGLRRNEAAQLNWKDIDLIDNSITINQTKNNEPLILPLTDYLIQLIKKRKKLKLNEFVFPGAGKQGFINDPKNGIKKVINDSRIEFSVHDLRRTFITIAESLDISGYAVKRLVNHKMSGDVTAGYIITDVERLRKPMQKITDFISLKIGIKKEESKIIELWNKKII